MYTGFTVRHKVLENQNSFEIALYIDDLDRYTMSMVFSVESALHYSVYKARETYVFSIQTWNDFRKQEKK